MGLNFEYNDIKIPNGGIYKISPSSLNKFFECSLSWYNENVLGQNIFEGNTASILGTVVHACLEAHYNGEYPGKEAANKEISEFLDVKYADRIDIDKEAILKYWNEMFMATIAYIDDSDGMLLPKETETSLTYDLGDGVYVAGSADAINDDRIIDYKTVATIRNQNDLKQYRLQLMTYAYIAIKNGYKINKITVIYTTVPKRDRISEKTGKPMKDYPSIVEAVEEVITEDKLNWIEKQLMILKDVYLLGEKEPEMRRLLYRDNINSFYHKETNITEQINKDQKTRLTDGFE
jgi:hypothetical protein